MESSELVPSLVSSTVAELKEPKGNSFGINLLKLLLSKCSLSKINFEDMYYALGNSLLKNTAFTLNPKVKNDQLLLFAAITKKLNKYEQVIARLEGVYRNQSWRTEKESDWNISDDLYEGREIKYVGLVNMGATCYVNALVQQLFMITSFRKFVLGISGDVRKERILHELQCLFGVLHQKQLVSYKAKKFYDSMNVEINVQKDTSEFLTTLFDALSKSLVNLKQPSFITQTFEIKTVTTIKCTKCGNAKTIPATILLLGLPVKDTKSIFEGLESFIKIEKLQGDNAYSCGICNEKVIAEKQEKLKTLPNILLIQLKRFDLLYGANNMKLNTYCEFPYELSLKDYTSLKNPNANKVYDDYFNYSLKGVIVHTGLLNSGHYYSLIKNSSDQTWVRFDDTVIEDFDITKLAAEAFGSAKDESSRNAYILIYERSVQLSKQVCNAFELNCVNEETADMIEQLKKPQMDSQVAMSECLQELVCEEQRDLVDRRLIFNRGFAQFVIALVKEGDSIDKLYEFGLNYLFTALARSDMRDLLFELTMILEQRCSEKESVALNVVKDFSVPSILRELVLGCPKADARKCVAVIVKASIARVYEAQSDSAPLANLAKTFIQQLDNLKLNICGEYFSILTEFVRPRLMSFLSNYQLIGTTLELLKLPVETSWRKIVMSDVESVAYKDPTFVVPSLNCFIEPDKMLVENEFGVQAPYMIEFLTKLINAYDTSKDLPVDFVELQMFQTEATLNSLIRLASFSNKGEEAFLDLMSSIASIEKNKYAKQLTSLLLNKLTRSIDMDLPLLLKAFLLIATSLFFQENFGAISKFIIKELRNYNSIYFANICHIDFIIELYKQCPQLVGNARDLVEAASDWLECNPFPSSSVQVFVRLPGSLPKKAEFIVQISKQANADRLKAVRTIKNSGKLSEMEDAKEIKESQEIDVCISNVKGKVRSRRWVRGTVMSAAKFAVKVKLEDGTEEWIERNANLLAHESTQTNPKAQEKDALTNLYYEFLN